MFEGIVEMRDYTIEEKRFAKYKDWPTQILVIAFQLSQLFLTGPAVN